MFCLWLLFVAVVFSVAVGFLVVVIFWVVVIVSDKLLTTNCGHVQDSTGYLVTGDIAHVDRAAIPLAYAASWFAPISEHIGFKVAYLCIRGLHLPIGHFRLLLWTPNRATGTTAV